MNRRQRRKTGKQASGGAVDAARLEALFRDAVTDHKAGRLEAAERRLKKIRKIQPDIPEVLHLSAIVALEDERPGKAAGYLRRAVRIMPGAAEIWNLLGAALQAAGTYPRIIPPLLSRTSPD